jgi:hypothetical protein
MYSFSLDPLHGGQLKGRASFIVKINPLHGWAISLCIISHWIPYMWASWREAPNALLTLTHAMVVPPLYEFFLSGPLTSWPAEGKRLMHC